MGYDVNPDVISQRFDAGAQVSGVAPNGVSSDEANLRGRWLKFSHCTDGGLITLPVRNVAGEAVPPGAAPVSPRASTSLVLQSLFYDLPGSGGITLALIDPDGDVVRFFTTTTDFGEYNPNWPTMILPSWRLRVTKNNGAALGAAGYIWASFGRSGLWQDTFLQTKELGAEVLPPRHTGGC